MIIEELSISGCYLITPNSFSDKRGEFVKTYHTDLFAEKGIDFVMKEEFYSLSHKGVIRGLHFQLPPHEHMKMVYCLKGKIFDVFLDIRKSSPTYGKNVSLELGSENKKILLLPPGIAHGFCALEDESVVTYKLSAVYSPESDVGIHWNSAGIKWPGIIDEMLVSDRDNGLPYFCDFQSSFL